MRRKKISGIYSISNTLNGKIYIGSSVDLHARRISHFNTLRTQKHRNRKLQMSYNKHGEQVFVYDIVELCEKQNLINREQFWIDFIRPHYNIMDRADRKTFTDEHRKNLSISHLGNKHTDEAKRKIGAASKGNKYRLGHKISEDQKQKIRNAKKGKRGRTGPDNPLWGKKRPESVYISRMKPVIQMSLSGEFIYEYRSIKEASQKTGFNYSAIRNACAGITRNSNGYKWKSKI